MTFAQMFLEKVNKTKTCWLWTGAIRNSEGYGAVWRNKRVLPAHRISYELFVGPIPEGLQIDHLCRVRNCVNPKHLEPVSPRENQHRSPLTSAGKTHCKQGHPFDEQNIYRAPTGGRRGCRICRRQSVRSYAAKIKREKESIN